MRDPSAHLSKERRTELENLVRENPFLANLFESNRTDAATSHALQILSLVHRFDLDFYNNVVLKREEGLPPFEQVLKSPDVERVPRHDDQYWIRESAELRWLAEWEEKPEARASWAKEIATWLRLHRRDPAAVLALYLSCDLQEALTFFREEFQKSDDANDLPSCYALVEQVQSSLERIPLAERNPFLEIVARYRARVLFQQDFHRSVQYFPRKDAEDTFKEVLTGEGGKWILQLHAQGGMGKTMFIERMISHHLLKEPPYPLVARLDLDFLSVRSLSDAPWLISLEIGRQLDEQLSRPLFTDRQADIEQFRDLLYSSRSEIRSKRTDSELFQLLQKAREVSHWRRFVNRCRDLPNKRPLLVFLDTLEEASLRNPPALRKLLGSFEDLQKNIPQLRLILSGRYQLGREHLDKLYDKNLYDNEKVVALGPLLGDLGESFVRGLAPGIPPASAKSIVQMGDGNPFKMSMLCELVRVHPTLNLDELKKEEIDIAYVIKRVVERIPEEELGLRWLLRYGAIPRRLTFSFVRDVLQPLLIRALKGEVETAEEDVPREQDRLVWLKDAEAALSPQTLWDQLCKYTGTHGWITVDSKDNQTAVLHSDVRGPMRTLLRGQPIYLRLNRDAAAHFAKRAKDDPERWLEFKAVELYHRVQLAECDLVKTIKDAFEERPETRHAELRLELAREILKPEGDFSDAPDAVKAWASYEEADALAIGGGFRYLAFGDRRNEIRSSLRSAWELANKANFKLPSFVFTWRECLESAAPRWHVALFEFFFARSGEDKARYWLLLLDLFGQSIVPGLIINILSFLLQFWSKIDSTRIPRWVLRERYAASLIRKGNHRKAESVLSSILWEVVDKSELDRVRKRLIQSRIQSMNLKGAEAEIADYAADPDKRPERTMFEADVHLLRLDAWSALDCCEYLPRDYRYHFTRGRAFGQLLRINEALESFAQARQDCEDPVFVDQILVAEMRFRLFDAEMETQPLTRTNLDPVASSVWRIELEMLRAYQSRKDPNVATGILTQLAGDRFAPHVRARAILAGIFWKLFEKTQSEDLGKILKTVSPVGARLDLLRKPVTVGDPIDLDWSTRSTILNNFVMSPIFGSHLEGTQWLLYAALLRILKQEQKKSRALARIKVTDPGRLTDLVLYRHRKRLEMDAGPDPVSLWEALEPEPGLHAAALIENAERAQLANERTNAEISLSRAFEVIQKNNLDSLFESRLRKVAERTDGYSAPIRSVPPSAPSSTVTTTEPRPASIQAEVGPDPSCFSLSCVSGRLFVEEAGEKAVKRVLSITENESLNILVTSLRERSPQRLTSLLMENSKAVVEDLREPFVDTPNSPLKSTAHQEIFLALKDSPLIAAPWEYALPYNITPVRIRDYTGQFLIEMLNRPGPNARPSKASKVNELKRDDRMRVVVLRNRLLAKVNPLVGAYALDLGEYYEGRGAACRDAYIEGNSVPNLEEVDSVNIVHIVGDFEDNPHLREPQFGGLTAEALGRSLRAIRVVPHRLPLVILDVPMISIEHFSFAAEQLYARNQFAQLLANIGGLSAVLAVGFGLNLHLLGDAIFDAELLVDIPRIVRHSWIDSHWRPDQMDSEDILLSTWGPMGVALFMADDAEFARMA